LLVSSNHIIADIAHILVDLKTPESLKTKSKSQVVSSLSIAASKTSSTAVSPLTAALAREKRIAEQIAAQYKQLRTILNSLPSSSNRMNPRLQPAPPMSNDLDSAQEFARSRLASQHRAAHEMIQKRVLQAAEMTLRLLVESSSISTEEARADLKATIQSYEEVLVSVWSDSKGYTMVSHLS
jgi:hypothetical protein